MRFDTRRSRRRRLDHGSRRVRASAHGADTQAVTWDLKDGNWSVVVMNADASRIIDTAIGAGANVPFLAAAAWVSVGAGVLLLTVAGALLVRGARRPRNRSTAAVPLTA